MASKMIAHGVASSRTWGGPGYISGGGGGDPPGLASRGGSPASIRLVLYSRDDFKPVGLQWSLPNGHYQFNNLDPNRKFFLIGFDHLMVYQASVSDQITPKV